MSPLRKVGKVVATNTIDNIQAIVFSKELNSPVLGKYDEHVIDLKERFCAGISYQLVTAGCWWIFLDFSSGDIYHRQPPGKP